MAITIEKLTELLNHDLELEYSAAIQYINHQHGIHLHPDPRP
jgi:hypothetical protein